MKKYTFKVSFIVDRDLNGGEMIWALKGQLDTFLEFSQIDDTTQGITSQNFKIHKIDSTDD